jgi:hypothetical protein
MSNELKTKIPGIVSDYHGYDCRTFEFAGREARIAEPREALPGRPWIWRVMFWDAFPSADIGLLERGFHVAYVDIGDTFASPTALKLLDDFYSELTRNFGFSKRPALEGLSRGGFCAYRWAYFNPEKVGCLYGDAPLCDIYLLNRQPDDLTGIPSAWKKVMDAYGHTEDMRPLVVEGNPVDSLATLAEAGVPIIHVCGSDDTAATNPDNNDIVQMNYPKLSGEFVLIMKEGCPHHPHGLKDPTLVVDYIVGKCADGPEAEAARLRAPRAGAVITLPPGAW